MRPTKMATAAWMLCRRSRLFFNSLFVNEFGTMARRPAKSSRGFHRSMLYEQMELRQCLAADLPLLFTQSNHEQNVAAIQSYALVSNAADQLSIGSITVDEGDNGTAVARFVVNRSGPNSNAISVDFATSNGTATAPSDYSSQTGTLVFSAGEVTKTIDVPIHGDRIDESDEAFEVKLTNVRGGTITKGVATATIVDDDSAGILLVLEQGPLQVSETGTQLHGQVRLLAQPSSPVHVHLSVAPLSEIKLNSRSVEFDALNWNVPQTVTIVGQPDLVDDGHRLVAINFVIDPATSAREFEGIGTQLIVVSLDEPVNMFRVSIDDDSLVVSDAVSSRFLARYPSAGSSPSEIELGSLNDTVFLPSLVGHSRPVKLKTAGGDDVIEAADWSLGSLDGGDGIDTLRLVGSNQELNFARLPDKVLNRIEVLDFSQATGASAVNLEYAELIRQFPLDGNLLVRLGTNASARFGSRWTAAPPTFVNGEVRHVLLQGAFRLEVTNSAIFTNPVDELDVDRSGIVTPLDVLLIVNAINLKGGSSLPHPQDSTQMHTIYVDANHDGFLSAFDALLIVNYLNTHLLGAKQGAGESLASIPIDLESRPTLSQSQFDAAVQCANDHFDLETWLERQLGRLSGARK